MRKNDNEKVGETTDYRQILTLRLFLSLIRCLNPTVTTAPAAPAVPSALAILVSVIATVTVLANAATLLARAATMDVDAKVKGTHAA